MAKNSKDKIWSSLFIVFIVPFVLIGCDPDFNTPVNSELKEFTIDSQTILTRLDQEDTDVFILIKEELEEDQPVTKSIFWEQGEYFQVAQTLHQELWQTSLEKNMYYMRYVLDCADINKEGFSSAMFKSVKLLQVGEDKHRIEYSVYIFPSGDYILTLMKEYGSTQGRLTDPIDLDNYEITAEEALQIAEENGAKEIRLEHENECSVTVSAPGTSEEGWYITYSNTNNENNLYYGLLINPQNGKVEKTKLIE